LPQPIYATVDAVAEFAEQFTRLEAENSQLRKTVRSSADQVLEANRLATDAKNENILLREEVKKLKQLLKDEQDVKRAAAAAIDKKEGALRESIKDLLGKIHNPPFFVLAFLSLIADLPSFQMLPT
jgi:predicted  nucleic acid-binding Zn-ribbon protein